MCLVANPGPVVRRRLPIANTMSIIPFVTEEGGYGPCSRAALAKQQPVSIIIIIIFEGFPSKKRGKKEKPPTTAKHLVTTKPHSSTSSRTELNELKFSDKNITIFLSFVLERKWRRHTQLYKAHCLAEKRKHDSSTRVASNQSCALEQPARDGRTLWPLVGIKIRKARRDQLTT